jgi:hypothetical protein
MASTAPALKNKRLAERDRSVLLNFAHNQIQATEDRAALDAAYERAADAISALVRKDNPPADMKVLAKYNLATPDSCIDISAGGYNYDQFEFRDEDKRIAMRPYSRRGCGGGRRPPILLEGEAEQAFAEYRAAKKALEGARKVRINDFRALIYGTPSFNALAEAWPAAETWRDKIVGTGTALAVLSSEVVERLKADPAMELAEAA